MELQRWEIEQDLLIKDGAIDPDSKLTDMSSFVRNL